MKICLLYIKRKKERQNSCENIVISKQADKVIMSKIKREIYKFLYFTEEAILYPKKSFTLIRTFKKHTFSLALQKNS